MNVWWWYCDRCGYHTRNHHSLGTAEADRDEHRDAAHPGSQWQYFEIRITEYHSRGVHA